MADKLIFFGTGPVSLACLEGISGYFEIEAIITKPDRVSPSGSLHATPVKTWAAEHHTPVYQPATKAELAELVTPGRFTSRVGLVVDYGLIIPESVIDAFPLGIVNSHFSLLPQWRGADPLTFSILSGQPVTGVSLMLIVPALDEGELLAQREYQMPPGINIDRLTHDLSDLSNRLLIDKLPEYIHGDIQPRPQQSARAVTYSRKLTKADGDLDWSKPAARLEREVRAFLGWPGSRTVILNKDVIVTNAHIGADNQAHQQGETFITPEKHLAIGCGDGSYLVIERLKPAGKREMTGQEYLAGHRR
jgi:methionyl-tRNA formyltransferase